MDFIVIIHKKNTTCQLVTFEILTRKFHKSNKYKINFLNIESLHHATDQGHRIGKEQKAHSFDLLDAAATRRNPRVPMAAMLLARSSQPDQ